MVTGSMAYDPSASEVVLFGGNTGSALPRTTWTWDGTTWSKQHPVTSPPARVGNAAAYDATLHAVLMFGGYSDSGT